MEFEVLIEEILADAAEQGEASHGNEGVEGQAARGPPRRVVVLGGGTHTRQPTPQAAEPHTDYF